MNDITNFDLPTSPMSAKVPNLQLAWDSTSLGELKRCAQRYKYVVLDGWTTGEPSDDLLFGIIFHSATELYEKLKQQGADHEKAVIEATRHVILSSWDFENNRPFLTGEEPTKTRETLLRTTIWYLDQFRNDPIKTITLPSGQPAVEVSFRFSLSEDEDDTRFRSLASGEEFILCGHLDKIGIWNETLWIVDKKTTKYQLDDYYFQQYYPDNQMSLYDIAGAVVLDQPVAGVIVDAAQVLVGGSRFKRRPIHRTEQERDDWLADLSTWLHMAEMYAVTNRWPKNEKGCGFGKMTCMFRGICSSDPRIRQEKLENEFVKRPRWNPLEPR